MSPIALPSPRPEIDIGCVPRPSSGTSETASSRASSPSTAGKACAFARSTGNPPTARSGACSRPILRVVAGCFASLDTGWRFLTSALRPFHPHPEGETPVTHAAHYDSTTRHLVALSILLGLALAPEIAAANVLDNFGNAILGILNNTFLRALAIVAVIGSGLMALSGRIQWMAFIVVMLAVVIIFGSAGIVDYIRDNSATAALGVTQVFGHVV